MCTLPRVQLPRHMRSFWPAAASPLALGFIGLLVVSATATAQTCPTSCWSVVLSGYSGWQDCSASPQLDQIVRPSGCYQWCSNAQVVFDVQNATFRLHAKAYFGVTSSSVVLADRFRIAGPEATTPLELTVGLRCSGGGYHLQAGLSEGEATPSLVSFPVWQSVDTTLETTVLHHVGEEFELRYGGSATVDESLPNVVLSGQSTDLTGALVFTGLPAGYTVESCQGYRSTAVAVTSVTWTLVKTLYRD